MAAVIMHTPNQVWKNPFVKSVGKEKTIFLAGTIDMGNSDNWQYKIYNKLSNMSDRFDNDITIYNPRRHDGFDDNPKNIEFQINWELEHLDSCDLIFMYIKGDSKSPISLMELGLFAKSGKLVVCCEYNFYRYDNVRITCEHYNVPLYNDVNEMFEKEILK